MNAAIRSNSSQKTARLAASCLRSHQQTLIFNLQRRNFALQSYLNTLGGKPSFQFAQGSQNIVSPSSRAFFGKSKKDETKETQEEKSQEPEQAADGKQPEQADGKEAENDQTASTEESKDASEKSGDQKASSSSSSDSSDSEDVQLGKEDIVRIKKLFNEQEEDISRLEAEVKSLEKQLKEKMTV